MLGLSKSEKRLKELEEQMLKLTRIVESHDLDWVDMRQRCKRLLDRTEKAAQRLETPEDLNDRGEPSTSETTEVLQGGDRLPTRLSPSQARLQAQILRLRRTA